MIFKWVLFLTLHLVFYSRLPGLKDKMPKSSTVLIVSTCGRTAAPMQNGWSNAGTTMEQSTWGWVLADSSPQLRAPHILAHTFCPFARDSLAESWDPCTVLAQSHLLLINTSIIVKIRIGRFMAAPGVVNHPPYWPCLQHGAQMLCSAGARGCKPP